MSVTVTLSPLSLVAPVVTGSAVSVDLEVFPLVVDADLKARAVEVTVAELGRTVSLTTYTVVGGKNRFVGSIGLPPDLGTYNLTLKAKNAVDATATEISPNLTFQVIRASNVDCPQALPPSGIRIYRLANRVRVEWQKPMDEGFLGVRVVVSPDSSGVESPFVQWGELVAVADRTGRDTLATTVTHAQNGNHFITTTDEERVPVPYSSTTFPRTQVEGDEFYVALSTVIQDPTTHHVHESYAAGPFKCSFVDLRTVGPKDFPAAMTPEEIAVAVIQDVAQEYPTLDLGPRSELRDLYIDPFALELSNAATRSWFSMVCHSVDALIGIDDADGDGVSDAPGANEYKQAIAKAFRLSDAQVQSLLDSRFDILGNEHGVPRAGTQSALVDVLFYVLTRPSKRITIDLGAMVNTVPDEDTPSVTFRALGSAVLDPSAADSFYLPDINAWGVKVPCICTTPGTVGNVGSGTLKTIISGVSQSMLCTNPYAADYGQDVESNHDYASRIRNRQVVGVDTGRTLGYEEEARRAYGVVDVKAVPSGRLEMLRDWDPVRQKHIFGTVDVYARGRSFGQSTQKVPYLHATTGTTGAPSTYTKLRLLDAQSLKFGLDGSGPAEPMCALVELYAERQGIDPTTQTTLSFYLGVAGAKFDPTTQTVFLDPEALTYRLVDGEPVYGGKNTTLVASLQSGTTLWARVRTWSPLELVPLKQPVSQVYSIVGAEDLTGVIPTNQVRLIKTQDPLLDGGSARSTDKVLVDNATTHRTVTLRFEASGAEVLDLGEGAAVTVDSQGYLGGLTSLLSLDSTILYGVNRDYILVPLGQYGRFGVKRTVNSRIPLDTDVKAAFPVYRFHEHLSLVTETLTLTGSRFSTLNRPGFVHAEWIPTSHGLTTLSSDAALIAAKVARSRRYIKVVYNDGLQDNVMVEGKDFLLTVDETTGTAQLARFYSGSTILSRIPDGASVRVTYYTAEVFDVTTRYPQFVEQITERLESTRHAAADVLVKTMQDSPVDLDFTVTLAANATPEIVDRKIRTQLVAAFDNARTSLSQAEIVHRVKAVPGVANVSVPFRRMAKADGAYDIGMVIPTNTPWVPLSALITADPTFANKGLSPKCWITAKPVLRYSTMPGGGRRDSYVGLLYEGEAYKRVYSLAELRLAQEASFYIIGMGDQFDRFTPVSSVHWGKVMLILPAKTTVQDPGQQAYRLTYQVFGEGGARDIPMSPTEYLTPGRLTIDYVLDGETR